VGFVTARLRSFVSDPVSTLLEYVCMQFLISFLIMAGCLFAGLYLNSYRKLLKFLKSNYSEEWKELGSPTFFSDDFDELKKFLQFLWSHDDIQNPELSILKIKTKKFLIAGIVLIGGSLSYLIIWLLITILFKK